MNLLDTLTKEDNKLIEDYIDRFGIPLKEYCGNQVFLRYWAKNKENLYHLLAFWIPEWVKEMAWVSLSIW